MTQLTAEQLLLVARQFCRHHRVQIVRFDAFVAASAAAGAKIDGIPVHDSPRAAAKALVRALTLLAPLSDKNREFAQVCGQIYLSVTEGV